MALAMMEAQNQPRRDAIDDLELRHQAIRNLKAHGHKQPKMDQIRAEIRRLLE